MTRKILVLLASLVATQADVYEVDLNVVPTIPGTGGSNVAGNVAIVPGF